jgi:hypothetical protein
MSEPGSEAPRRICCLLYDLGPGGATWQSIRLLAGHVKRGGQATIFAQPGSLAEIAQGAGIDVWSVTWGNSGDEGKIWRAVREHDAAIVQWELGPIESFARALEECRHVALAVHGAPQTTSRRLAPPAPMKLRRALEQAATNPRAVACVCGAAHRRKVAAAYGIPTDALQVVPPFVPLDKLSFRPRTAEPREVLAMTRLGPEKMSIVRVAVELVGKRLAGGHECRLAVAGDGARRGEAVELCERRLPRGSWRIESAPGDPTARLAEADLVVAQGVTTLEAAALGRRVVVARSLGAHEASGAVLTPENYDEAACDPFGDPSVSENTGKLWDETQAINEEALTALRRLIETYNSPERASQALDDALAQT